MSNYKEVLDLTTTSENALGTATQKMEIWQEGLEAKTNELKAAWEGLLISLQQSDSLKTLMDIGIWALNNLPTLIGLLTTITLLFKGDKIVSGIQKVLSGAGKLTTVFSGLKKNLDILKLGWYRNADGILTVANAEETAAASSAVLGSALTALVAIITASIALYNSWKQANVDAANAAIEEADAYGDKAKAMEDAIEEYKEIYNSSDDYNTKQEQLKTLSEDLKTAYGEEAEALGILNGKYEDNVEAMEKAANEKRRQELASLKVAADKGEGNLNNWTNALNDVDYKTDAIKVSEENKNQIQEIKDILGDSGKLISSNYVFSEVGPRTLCRGRICG